MVYIHLLTQDLVLHSFILKEKPKQTILCHCSSESESVLFACCTNSNIKQVNLFIYHIKTTDVDQSVVQFNKVKRENNNKNNRYLNVRLKQNTNILYKRS